MNKSLVLKIGKLLFLLIYTSCINTPSERRHDLNKRGTSGLNKVRRIYSKNACFLSDKLPSIKGYWQFCIENFNGIQYCNLVLINNFSDTIFLDLDKSIFWLNGIEKHHLEYAFIDSEILPKDTMAILLKYYETNNSESLRKIVGDTSSKLFAKLILKNNKLNQNVKELEFQRSKNFKIYTSDEFENRFK